MKPTFKLLLLLICCGVITPVQIFNDIIPGHIFHGWMTRINMYTNEGEHNIKKCLF